LAFSLVLVAVFLSVLRLSLPYMDQQKQFLEDYLSEQFGASLSIGSISADWRGSGPVIVFQNVELSRNTESPVSLTISETEIEVDFWHSVLARQIQSNKFDLYGLHLTVDLNLITQSESDYPIIDALERLFLQQLQSFSVNNGSIELLTANKQQTVLIDELSWVNKDDRHQGVGEMQIADIAKNSASFILDLTGNDDELSGTFFAQAKELDLAPWVSKWLDSRYALTDSRGSFVMWIGIKQKAIESVQLDLSNSRFDWQLDEQQISAEIQGGQLYAKPVNGNWLMNFNNFALAINEHTFTSSWRAQRDQQGRLTLSNIEDIALAPLLSALPLFIDDNAMEMLRHLQPEAFLKRLQVQMTGKHDFDLSADVRDVSWQQYQGIPGLSNLNAAVNWHNGQGSVHISSATSVISVDQTLPNDIKLNYLDANFWLKRSEAGIDVFTDNLVLTSPDLSLKSQLFYRTNDNFLALGANIAPLDIGLVAQFYPADLMGIETRDYLVDALKSGRIEQAQTLWFGKLGDFPYAQNQGVFQATVVINDATLKFDSNWPALTQFNAQLLFENESLHIVSQQGQLDEVTLANLNASIPSLSENAILTIQAKAMASGASVRDLIKQSNLADSLGSVFKEVQFDGQLTTDLNLHIPLSDADVVASGKVILQNNPIYLGAVDLALENVTGLVEFVNEQVKFKDLKATLFGQHVFVDFVGKQSDAGYAADISVNADWDVTTLSQSYYAPVSAYLAGNSKWQAKIALLLPEQGYEYQASLSSQLDNLQSQLPAPLNKLSSETLPLVVSVNGNQQASSINLKLGKLIEFNGNLPHENMQFSRAHLAIGESDLMGMGLGFSISANVDELDVGAWYQTISDLFSDMPQQDNPVLEPPKRIAIKAASALVAGQKFTDVEILAKNTSDSWLLDINAAQTRMDIALYKDWLGRGINITAEFIDINEWQSAPETEKSHFPETFTPNLAVLPPVNFVCKRCRLFDTDLGKIDFSLSRAATGMHIDSLRLNNANGLLYAQGDWFIGEGQSSTRLTGDFSSSDFGALLKDFQFNSGIKDSKATTKFDLSWQRAPYEFNYATLSGEMNWRLSDGYLTEVTDKGSRIFSILSLDSLVRKLKLDFRDVFAKGFFYDKMSGSFQINNGIVDTRDTLVDGGAGELTMYGYTDLNTQQLDYQIAFAPNVTSSLPVIVAWMVNPATALAALALDQVLTSAKVISNIKFALTGTIDEPKIEELGRDSKEVSLPAKLNADSIPQPQDAPLTEPVPVSLRVVTEEPISG
jgi:uncharacterized protein (TIGR02099 family)